MALPVAFCMLATPFKVSGEIDEDALRRNVNRMADAGNGIYLGSGGAGEGHALALDELAMVYRVGVDQCAGRVPVYANPPEQRTAAAMIRSSLAAAEAGVDVVQIYQLDAGHGMRPTVEEQRAYYEEIAEAVRHPLALSLHVNSGYVPPVGLVDDICRKYPYIVAINVIGLPAETFVILRDTLPGNVAFYTRLADAMTGLALGSSGTLSAENNIAPNLCAAVLSRWAEGDMAGSAAALADVLRLSSIVNRWAPSTARWIKMAMRVLNLPGGQGGLRPPYHMPDQTQLDALSAAFHEMDFARRELEAAPRSW